MSAPSKAQFPTGFRHCTIFALDANGFPAATSTTPYEGIHAVGAQTLTYNPVAPRRISHTGDDTVLQVVQLPPLEAPTAELHLSQVNDDLEALLTGKKSFDVAEANGLIVGQTDLDGFEPNVAVHAYQDSRGDDGKPKWYNLIFPQAVLYTQESGFSPVPSDRTYPITPQIVTSHLWGTAFDLATEGVSRGQMVRLTSRYITKIVAWKSAGAPSAGADTFLFPANAQAIDVNKAAVWVNGVKKTTNITIATSGITFTASYEPAANAIIVAKYEIAKED